MSTSVFQVRERGKEPKRGLFEGAVVAAPLLVVSFLLWGHVSQAQSPLSNLVVTVGTTIQTNGTNFSYVLIGSPQPQLLAGKRFAIYGKPGPPTNAASFTLRGTIFRQSDPVAIAKLLNQSIVLGEDLTSLGNALSTLLHNDPGITNLSLAQEVAAAFQIASTDPGTAQLLGLLAHVNPGLTMCAGQAFSEPINSITTYEVREVALATGTAAEVLGRVTVVPGSPVVLPAPGFPYQVKTNDPSDHLRIRLRWGTPPELRRLSLLGYGYNLWRIPLGQALAAGYNVTPPTLAQLYGGAFTRVNHAPVIASKDFSANHGPGGADDPADPLTYFFSDNNGHALGNPQFPTNSPPHTGYLAPAFNDGDQFFYFVTALDVLGRDGLSSPGGIGEACRRLRPQAPKAVRVLNNLQVATLAGAKTNLQRLLVTWQQNLNTNDEVGEYWVYRWPNFAMALTNDAAPFSNRIAVVSQVIGSRTNSYLDSGPGAPSVPGLSNYWYTVRAVSPGQCDPLLSPHSTPAWGVLRERFGPAGTTGQVLGSCGSPVVMFANFNTISNPVPDHARWNYRFTCSRRDTGIAWVQFFATNQAGAVAVLGPIYFPPDGDSVQADYSLPIFGALDLTNVACMVGTYYGQVSQAATAFFTGAPLPTQRLEAVFLAGQLFLTALEPNDPLLAAINGGQTFCVDATSAKIYPEGTVRLRFDIAPLPFLLIQVASNGPATIQNWENVGIATRDPNGFYWLSYPACLLGPLPHFRGCRLDLPDCDQHVRSADTGSVSPIQIDFVLTPRTHEYRLYRSVDNGPLTLLAQGAAVYDPADPGRVIVLLDDAMPPSAARLCYFVQLLDQHGNASPMTLLGCREVKPAKLPRPVLAQPHAVGDATNPQVQLDWFCPTSGVYRFQVLVQRADHPGGGLSWSGFSGTQLTMLPTYTTTASYLGLLENELATAQFDGALLTPPVGLGFGPGPHFTLTANVVTNVPYHLSVAAMDDQGNAGDASKVWTFTWTPTNPLPTVPWPARPLPTVKGFDEPSSPQAPPPPQRVQAVLLRNANLQLDQRYPVGIRIADTSGIEPPPFNIGTTSFVSYQAYPPPSPVFIPPPNEDPNTLVFHRVSPDASRNGEPLLPIVVYRQQVTNATFPRVSGSLTQVTPLIERFPYSATPNTNSAVPAITVTIYDRLIAGGVEALGAAGQQFLYVRDQQPVIIGASYQYFVVRFNQQHEISEIIPAGAVTIPAQ